MVKSKGVLTVTAQGRFLTMAMQVTGTEYWTAGGQNYVAPLQAAPVSVFFGRSANVVRASFPFHPGATAVITYTVEGGEALVNDTTAGYACHGAAVVFDHGYASYRPC